MELATVPVLARELGITESVVLGLIARAELAHAQEVPYGKGKMRLYDRADTLRRLRDQQALEAPPPPTPRQPQALPAAAPTAPTAADVLGRLFESHTKQLLRELNDTDDKISALRDLVSKLTEQNITLLRKLNHIEEEFRDRLNVIAEALTRDEITAEPLAPPPAAGIAGPAVFSVAPEFNASYKTNQTTPSMLAATPDPPQPPKPIVGLLQWAPQHKAQLEKEFGKVMDLRFYTIEEANRPDFSSKALRCDRFILMQSHAATGARPQAWNGIARNKLVRVTGGLTALHDKLTDIYVELTPKSNGASR